MEIFKNNKKEIFIIGVFLSIKIVSLMLYSSGYQDFLFKPFIHSFIENSNNPWDEIFINRSLEFPYGNFMLNFLLPFYYIASFFDVFTPLVANLIYGLPLLICDALICLSLLLITKTHKKKLILLFYISPIILFSTFIHKQLDIIPISLLLISILLIFKRKYIWSAIVFGCSISAKLSVLVSLPLLAIYIYKNKKLSSAIIYVCTSFFMFFLINMPYLMTESFIEFVILNNKQQSLFDSYIEIGNQKIFLPIFISLFCCFYFFTFKKINRDLLIAFIGLNFSIYLFFVSPSPGWYVWIVPFFSLSLIRSGLKYREGVLLLAALNIAYLFYFLFSHHFEYYPISILNEIIRLPKVTDYINIDINFTLLEALLFCNAIFIFQYSIVSNNLYKSKNPFIIGVGGDSGTGKSTLKLLLSDLYEKNILLIEGDGDHRWERGHTNWSRYTHLDPKANWLHRQSETLMTLKKWSKARVVDYDHTTGKFTEEYHIKPQNFILISGLHPFYLPNSRKLIDLKIYMEPDENLRRYWKIQRDMFHRGYSYNKIINQIESRISDAYKYIYPQKIFADLIISFFPQNKIEDYSKKIDLNIGLRIQCEASISIENILKDIDVEHSWNYAEDLNSQIIELYSSPDHVNFAEVTNTYIQNIDELIYDDTQFHQGYNGFIQLIILLSICQKMKSN